MDLWKFRWPFCTGNAFASGVLKTEEDTLNSSDASSTVQRNCVDTELISYLTECKAKKKNGLDFWLSEGHKLTALTPLAQDLLCAPASQAYVERVFFCVW